MNSPTMATHNDVSIFYMSSDGNDWAAYTHDKLGSKEYNTLPSVLNDLSNVASSPLLSTSVNVFFVTPDFQDRPDWSIIDQVDRRTCIIVLTGVERKDFTQAARFHKIVESEEWVLLEMDGGEKSVRDMIVAIISMYETDDPLPNVDPHTGTLRPHSVHQQSLYANMDGLDGSGDANETEDNINDQPKYDKLPPRRTPVKVNGIFQMLHKDGMTYVVMLHRIEAGVKIELDGQPVKPGHTDLAVYTLPQKTGRQAKTITVLQKDHVVDSRDLPNSDAFDAELHGAQERLASKCKQCNTISTQTENDRVSSISISTQTDSVIDVQTDTSDETQHRSVTSTSDVTSDMSQSSKCHNDVDVRRLSQLQQLHKQVEDSDAHLQLQHVSDQCSEIEENLECLDEMLASLVQCADDLKQTSPNTGPLEDRCLREKTETSLWPTLLHFGARFNLLRFCEELLGRPEVLDTCMKQNIDGFLPHTIAEQHGHATLADMLQRLARANKSNREGKYDSGFSGSSTPRVSAMALDVGSPPAPHKPFSTGYMNMNAETCHDFDDQVDEQLGSDPFSDIIDISTEYGESHSPCNREFVESQDTIDASTDTLTAQAASGKKKSGTKFLSKIFKKRSRSNSVPTIDVQKLDLHKKETKTYSRRSGSARSSATSSSSASIHSQSSIKEEDDTWEDRAAPLRCTERLPTCHYEAPRQRMASSAKRRESVRLNYARSDNNLEPPTLPERKPLKNNKH